MRVTVIINPVSGGRRRGDLGRRRRAAADRILRRHGVEPRVHLTEAPGHALMLARAALDAGCDLVVAWGGDGTVNEVATPLVGSSVPLAIVPAGSGNGLARELGIPHDPDRALACALGGGTRRIDVGQIAGRIFVNVAGVGLDASIARRFNALRGRSHGFVSYVAATMTELWRFSPVPLSIETGPGDRLALRATLVTFSNSAQYGNGARIAPGARPDDGLLDLVAVEHDGMLRCLWRARRLFDGSILRDRRVRHRRVARAVLRGAAPILFHVDGEPAAGAPEIEVCVRPGELLVKA